MASMLFKEEKNVVFDPILRNFVGKLGFTQTKKRTFLKRGLALKYLTSYLAIYSSKNTRK